MEIPDWMVTPLTSPQEFALPVSPHWTAPQLYRLAVSQSFGGWPPLPGGEEVAALGVLFRDYVLMQQTILNLTQVINAQDRMIALLQTKETA